MRKRPLQERSAERFGLAMAVTVDGLACACHDISATGLLLQCPAPVELGGAVALTLQYDTDGQDLSLDCRGVVVRVEQHGDSWNVAVRLDEPLFEEESVLQEGGTG
ncbi:MAG TPA: PilZ domain-containing protein [Ramlibacter sp.]|nr:PilZ domain-containing protein [Ramlibacter sp.]